MGMNFRFVSRQLGMLCLVLAASMLPPIVYEIWVAAWREVVEWESAKALGWTVLTSAGLGVILWFAGKSEHFDNLGRREALLLVGVSWLLGAALSALPFYIYAHTIPETYMVAYDAAEPFRSFAGCYFEATSGLTTTGATVLTNIEGLPEGLLLWRALTHWLGGLGIVVLFVAVLPMLGMGGKRLFQVEAAGPKQQGVRPRISDTARILWFIYLAITLGLAVTLRGLGMPWFDSFCHAFSTIATGGFSTKNASAGYYDSAAIQWVLVVFMFLGGVNFGLYYRLVTRQWKPILQDVELRVYFGVMVTAIISLAVYLTWNEETLTTGVVEKFGPDEALRHAAFQAASIQTTTGFATVDFDLWSEFPKAVLMILAFIGGCAGSTGGGIKVVRVIIAFKAIWHELERVFRPNVLRPVRVNGAPVDESDRLSVVTYILSIALLVVIGLTVLLLIEPPKEFYLDDAATATIACVFNIGPGYDHVGPIRNYGFFQPLSKVVLSLLMVLGRLEVFTLLVLLHWRFWRGE